MIPYCAFDLKPFGTGHSTGEQGEGYEGGATAGEGGSVDDAEAHQEDEDDLYADIAPGFAQVDGVSLGGHSYPVFVGMVICIPLAM